MKRILFLIAITILAIAADAARFRVSNTTATVWDAENPAVELGRMNPGNTFTSQRVEGTKIYLEYKGELGFVATYLCKEIPEQIVHEPAQTVTVAEQSPTRTSHHSKKTSDADILFNCLCGLWFFAGMVMAYYLLFHREDCVGYFNRKAGAKVASLISLKCFRPIGFMFFMGIGLNLYNLWTGVGLGCIYEAILLTYRARHFKSWRAAIVEALYLFLWSGGAIIIVSVTIIMLLLNTQPSRRGGNHDADECCQNCRYGSRNNDSTCSCRLHGTEVNMNSRCPHYTT